MLNKIKSLGTDTAVYGVSTVIGRFLTFILTPIYTHLLAGRSELGVVANVYAYIAFFNILYVYGMESAYFKYASTLEIGTEKDNFSVPFLSLCCTSVALTVGIFWQSDILASLAGIPVAYTSIVYYSGAILLFDALSVIPFARLRLQRKASRFATIKLIAIVINVLLNIVFLLRYHMGVEGIFLAGVISSATTVVLLIPTIVAALRPVFLTPLFKALLRFGLPYVPAGLAAMMIQVVDRPILQSLTNLDTVGLYQVNYRLGIFMMLIVSTFDFAWRPFFLSHAGDPEAKPMFARILTYFYLFMMCVFIGISLFLRDVVTTDIFFGRPIISEPYWSGLSIVPVVLLGYVFLGISNNLVAGIYIEKKTKHLPGITFVGLFVNVGVNYLLIPQMGIMGAAIATLLSYAVMAAVLYTIVQRFYPVRYEFARLAKITLSAALVMGIYYTLPAPIFPLLWKSILLILFGISMYAMHFFEPAEIRQMLQALRMQSSHGTENDG